MSTEDDRGAVASAGPSKGAGAGASFALAAALTAIGTAAVALGSQIELSGFTDRNDPGPRLVPVGAGIVLFGGGIFEFIRWWSARRLPPPAPVGGRGSLLPVVIMLGGFVAYAAALPVLGFSLATSVFTVLVVRLLGSRWWVAVVVAAGTVALVNFLFVGLFKVQLPAGLLGFPG